VTPEHLERLFRTTPEVVFCFDGDQAGQAAAWKALNNALPLMREGRQARFLLLPQGEDPDSMIRREGQDAFEQRIRNAAPLSDFLFDKLSQGLSTSSLDGQARLAEQAKPLLNRLPSGVFREMMYQRLAEMVGLSPAKLGGQPPGGQGQPPRLAARRSGPRRITLQLRAIALLMQHPQLARQCPDLDPAWRAPQTPGAELFGKILDLLRIEPNLTTAVLLERWRGAEEGAHLARAAALNLAIPEGDEEQEFLGAVQRLTEQYKERELERLLEKSSTTAVTAADKQRLMQLLSARSAANDREDEPDV
jgi:DNA primase